MHCPSTAAGAHRCHLPSLPARRSQALFNFNRPSGPPSHRPTTREHSGVRHHARRAPPRGRRHLHLGRSGNTLRHYLHSRDSGSFRSQAWVCPLGGHRVDSPLSPRHTRPAFHARRAAHSSAIHLGARVPHRWQHHTPVFGAAGGRPLAHHRERARRSNARRQGGIAPLQSHLSHLLRPKATTPFSDNQAAITFVRDHQYHAHR